MNDRQRLEAVVSVVCKYLPPDGIDIGQAMNEIIGLVDPLPPQPKEPEQKPVAWIYEDELLESYPYDAMFEKSRVMDGVRMFPQIKNLKHEPVLIVEKEPAYMSQGHYYEGTKPHIDPTKVWKLAIGTKLYTTPPQRTWVGLTDEEKTAIYEEEYSFGYELIEKTEAKLKAKNERLEKNTHE